MGRIIARARSDRRVIDGLLPPFSQHSLSGRNGRQSSCKLGAAISAGG